MNMKRLSMSKNRSTFPGQPRMSSKPLQTKSYGGGGSATTMAAGSSSQYLALSGPESPGESSGPHIPHVKCQDNAKLLPKYTQALLTRSPHDLLPAEDLDAVQQELELLLSTVALRFRVLKSEIESLDKAEQRSNKIKYMDRQPASPTTQIGSGGGKKKRYEDKNKHREGPSKLMSSHHLKQAKMKQVIPSPSHMTDDSLDAVPYFQDRHQKDNQKLFQPKNDTPNKFWLSVEPYAMPITQEDLKLLDDLIEEYSGPLIPPIPELGPHYSQQWAIDDLKDEQDNSNATGGAGGGGGAAAKKTARAGSMQNGEVASMMRKGEKLMGEGVTGPLTQRLVSALMEENLISDNALHTDSSNSGSENISHNMNGSRGGLQSLLKNGISIERRVRKELIEQGILDADDFGKYPQEDEILTEIKRVRTELASIAEYNSNELRKLHAAAKDEMKRLEIKRKLDTVDQEIIETYKRVTDAKLKRRPLTKQDREEIYRLTAEQKKLSDQLEAMPGVHFSAQG